MGRRGRAAIQREATRLLQAGVAGQVFPGAVACIGYRDGVRRVFVGAIAGDLTRGGAPVREDTPYDLASLTKPVVAVTALRLAQDDRLPLGVRVDSLLPDVRGGPGGAATLEQLLAHRSGLAPWGGLYLDVPHDVGSGAARRWILSEASRRREAAPGTRVIYSDLGYMIAGEVIARVGGETLDRVIEQKVTRPLGISDVTCFAGALPSDRRADLARRAAPTERCEWRDRVVCGEVHDENCAALGGVAGHAGLFGTAETVAVFGRAMIDCLAGRSDFLPQTTMQAALAERPGGSHRLGFDAKSGDDSAAGRRMSMSSFGHLGFTGTSLWCDPERDLVVVLLTNRVHPSRANTKIKGFRPAFHDGVLAAYD